VEQLRRIGVQVRGILEVTPERGEAKAQALGVTRAYPSLEAILEDRPSMSSRDLAEHLHVEQARQSSPQGSM